MLVFLSDSISQTNQFYQQMLPEYSAVSFLGIIERGGRTKPWVVTVDTGVEIKTYVVKLFTEEQIATRNSVVNEVIGSVLANDFELQVPKPALITFSDTFISTLTNDQRRILEKRDQRIKFGCELLNSTNLFQQGFDKKLINKNFDLDTLFAFDNLIRNRDRTKTKPNLLFTRKNVWLIDHELGFERVGEAISAFNNGVFSADSGHLFCGYLNKASAKSKQKYFNAFQEYLRNMSVSNLNSYYQQLTEHKFKSNEVEIKDWLGLVKQNSTKFVNLLKAEIR